MIVRFAGFGGQGVVLSSFIIGRSAAFDGKHALQNQAYGSEARGGECRGDVVISDEEICELESPHPDVLVVMAQPAYDKFVPMLKANGTLFYDQGLVEPVPNTEPAGIARHGLSATNIALKKFGRKIVANMVLLGYMNGALNLVSEDALVKAVSRSVPNGTQELNLRALREGIEMARSKRGVAEDVRAPDAGEQHRTTR